MPDEIGLCWIVLAELVAAAGAAADGRFRWYLSGIYGIEQGRYEFITP